eukprot:6357971-Prymnesium_polylepis.1
MSGSTARLYGITVHHTHTGHVLFSSFRGCEDIRGLFVWDDSTPQVSYGWACHPNRCRTREHVTVNTFVHSGTRGASVLGTQSESSGAPDYLVLALSRSLRLDNGVWKGVNAASRVIGP